MMMMSILIIFIHHELVEQVKKELYYTLTKVNANLIQISMCILCSALLGSFQTNYTFTMPVILLSDKTNRASYIKKAVAVFQRLKKNNFIVNYAGYRRQLCVAYWLQRFNDIR